MSFSFVLILFYNYVIFSFHKWGKKKRKRKSGFKTRQRRVAFAWRNSEAKSVYGLTWRHLAFSHMTWTSTCVEITWLNMEFRGKIRVRISLESLGFFTLTILSGHFQNSLVREPPRLFKRALVYVAPFFHVRGLDLPFFFPKSFKILGSFLMGSFKDS